MPPEDQDPNQQDLDTMIEEVEIESAEAKLTNQYFRNLSDLQRRFTYHAPKDGQPQKYEDLRRKGHELAMLMLDACPESRELSLAWTKLEEAVMWANAAIARRS